MSQLTQANQTAIDASHLKGVLEPELRIRLAILQAATDLDGALAYGPVVSDLIGMYESASRINKKLIEQESLYTELVQELDTLSLSEHRITTRLEQIRFWQILRQGEIRLEMANLEADVSHTTRRFRSATTLISLFVFLVCLHFCDLALGYLHWEGLARVAAIALLVLIAAVARARTLTYLIGSANSEANVDLLQSLDDEVQSYNHSASITATSLKPTAVHDASTPN